MPVFSLSSKNSSLFAKAALISKFGSTRYDVSPSASQWTSLGSCFISFIRNLYSFARIAQQSIRKSTPYGSFNGSRLNSNLQYSIPVRLQPFLPIRSIYLIKHSAKTLLRGSASKSSLVCSLKLYWSSSEEERGTNEKSKLNADSKAKRHLSKKPAASANFPYILR